MRYNTIGTVLFLIALCQFWRGTAQHVQDPRHYDLKQLLVIAKENNKDLQLLLLELRKTNQDVLLRKSGYLPKVDAFADYYRYLGNMPLFVFPENEGSIISGGTSSGPYPVSLGLPNNLIAGVSLSQRLFEFSYLSAGKNKEILGKLETGRINEKKEQLYYDVAVAYYEVMKLALKEDLIDFNLLRLDRFMDIMRVQLKNQMTDSLQLSELELTKAELMLSKDELRSGLQRKTHYLKMLTGLPDSATIIFDVSDFKADQVNIQVQNDTGENEQLNLLNQAQKLNELSQKQVHSDYLPTLDLKLNLLWNSQSQDLAFFSNPSFNNQLSTVGLKLDFPLYNGSAKNKKIQKLEIDRQIIELQKQKLAEGYQLQYSNSLEELNFKSAHYKHLQEITSLKIRFLEKANRQFDQGLLPIKDLLNAESELSEARMKEAESLYDVKLAELNYFKWSNQILTRFE